MKNRLLDLLVRRHPCLWLNGDVPNNRLMATFALIVFTLVAAKGMSQNTITFCGGSTYGGAVFFSYTCGEVAVKSASDPSITVVDITSYFTEGVQQAFLARSLSIGDVNVLDVRVYPNPTVDGVVVESEDAPFPLTYELFDMQGKLQQHGTLVHSGDRVALDSFPSGGYLLSVTGSSHQAKKIYRIIKK